MEATFESLQNLINDGDIVEQVMKAIKEHKNAIDIANDLLNLSENPTVSDHVPHQEPPLTTDDDDTEHGYHFHFHLILFLSYSYAYWKNCCITYCRMHYIIIIFKF